MFEKTTGTKIPFVWAGRRVGDVDTLVCDAQLAVRELQWEAKYDATRMCKFRLLSETKTKNRIIEARKRQRLSVTSRTS